MAKAKTAKTSAAKSKPKLPRNAAEIFAAGKIVESIGKSLLKSVEGFKPKAGSSAHVGNVFYDGEIHVAQGAAASSREIATIGLDDIIADHFDRLCGGAVDELQSAVSEAVKQLKASRKSAKTLERHEEIKKTLAKLVESAAIEQGFRQTKKTEAKAGAVRTDPGYMVTMGEGRKMISITHERKPGAAA